MRCCLTMLLAVVVIPAAAFSDEPDIKSILSRKIIDANLPLREVQEFTESRVPRMPKVKTKAEWEQLANRLRNETLDKVVFRGEAAHWRTAKTKTVWLDTIDGGKGYKIRKLRYEALPGLWIPALLYVPNQLAGKVPVVLNVNGHDRANGKAATYKQTRCINMAKRGMLALNVEWLGMGQLNTTNFSHYRMNQLDLCGTSGLAPFYLAMSRGLDVLLSLEHADPKRVAVAGLSGGGWQTIIISSLDTRVTLADPVAGYSSFRTRARHFSDLGDSEQTPCDLATVVDYTHLTAMRAPLPTLLTFNAEDNCCFKSSHALGPLLEAARPIFSLYGRRDNLRSHVNYNPGNHNFDRDNREALYRMFAEHFYRDDLTFDPKEIACKSELKKKDDLDVEMPDNNADFHSLALALVKNMPRDEGLRGDASLTAWANKRRPVLRKIVNAKDYDITATATAKQELTDGKAVLWKLRIGSTWTIPAVELVPANAKKTIIVVADGGRKSVSDQIEKLYRDGNRVVAIDPFYFGESKIAQRDFLFALLVSAVGERPLGIQASQVAAVARWAHQLKPVTVVAFGPRSSLSTLIAAGLETQTIGEVVLNDSFKSLKQIIESNMTVQQTPELFCFGLLKEFDIPQLTELVAPRPVKFSVRTKKK